MTFFQVFFDKKEKITPFLKKITPQKYFFIFFCGKYCKKEVKVI